MDCQRFLFSLPERQHYLNCAYMSPLLKSVAAAGVAGLQRKAVPAAIEQAEFFEPAEELRRRFAELIHTTADRVALVPAASYGIAIALHNVPLRAGRNVVIPGEEFPSDVYGWMARCDRAGASLRLVSRPPGHDAPAARWNASLLDAVDGDTAVVVLSTVHWTDGTPFDLDALRRRTTEVGALLIVDGTQSVGACPFDFDRLGPDLLVCAGYKWLLGPYQYSFVAVGDALIEGEPFEYNWINRRDSEDFSRLTNYQIAYQPGARRFDAGERSNFIMVPMLNQALRQIAEWGVENIQEYCAGLVATLERALAGGPYALAPADQRSAHLFGIRLPDANRIPAVLGELRKRGVYVSQRGTSIRVSPHVYNTIEDVAALAEALRQAG